MPNRALEAWFRLLSRGKLVSIGFADFQKRTGLELEGEGGELREELPPIQRWLNRILALPIGIQNAVFDEFLGLVEARVAKARDAGTLDLGVETIAVETLEIVSEKLLRTDKSGATTRLLEVAITRKRRVRSLDEIDARRAWDLGAQPMRNAKSGLVALKVRQRSSLLDDGTSVRRFALIRPARIDHIDEAALVESNWGEIGDAAFATEWKREARETATRLEEDTLFIATGLLLPVWRKIPARMLSVVRIASADGRAILGRVVDAGDLGAICEGLGIDGPKLTPQAIVAAAKGGARVPVNGLDALVFKTSRVASAQRLELVGAPCGTIVLVQTARLLHRDHRLQDAAVRARSSCGSTACSDRCDDGRAIGGGSLMLLTSASSHYQLICSQRRRGAAPPGGEGEG